MAHPIREIDKVSPVKMQEAICYRKPDLKRAAHAIEEFLTALGFPPGSDPELAETGNLVAEAFSNDLLSGYRMDPAVILADRMPAKNSGLVIVSGIEVSAVCPHHLLPAIGDVCLSYLPNQQIVGLGVLTRLVDCFSRRFTLQETMTQRIADALVEHLGALGAGCVAKLSHSCLTARGERRQQARLVTVATSGSMKTDYNLRAEFLQVVGIEPQ